MATFDWVPDYEAPLSEEPRVLRAPFGDGYEQRVGDGINNNPRKWSLTFDCRDEDEGDAILAFLRAHSGVEAFDWTPPTDSGGRWVCRRWQSVVIRPALSRRVTAEFEEVFGS